MLDSQKLVGSGPMQPMRWQRLWAVHPICPNIPKWKGFFCHCSTTLELSHQTSDVPIIRYYLVRNSVSGWISESGILYPVQSDNRVLSGTLPTAKKDRCHLIFMYLIFLVGRINESIALNLSGKTYYLVLSGIRSSMLSSIIRYLVEFDIQIYPESGVG